MRTPPDCMGTPPQNREDRKGTPCARKGGLSHMHYHSHKDTIYMGKPHDCKNTPHAPKNTPGAHSMRQLRPVKHHKKRTLPQKPVTNPMCTNEWATPKLLDPCQQHGLEVGHQCPNCVNKTSNENNDPQTNETLLCSQHLEKKRARPLPTTWASKPGTTEALTTATRKSTPRARKNAPGAHSMCQLRPPKHHN